VQAANYQYGIIHSALAQPLRIRVTDAYENPVADAWVSWVRSHPAVNQAASSSRTDSRGELQATWILAGQVGTQRLLVSVAGAETMRSTRRRACPQMSIAFGPGRRTIGVAQQCFQRQSSCVDNQL
jgi:hypothetical protein